MLSIVTTTLLDAANTLLELTRRYKPPGKQYITHDKPRISERKNYMVLRDRSKLKQPERLTY